MERADGKAADIERLRPLLEDAFHAIWAGLAESDGFNRLVTASSVAWRDIVILRMLAKYLRQAGLNLSQPYMENALVKNPGIALLLVDLFKTMHDPKAFADMAARITTGAAWPCDEGTARQGSVILLTAEDDLADTVKPRLAAAGADMSRVHVLKMVKDGSKKRMFSLITDLDVLRKEIARIGGVVQVQIDPISAYQGVGRIDSFRTTDVRAVLAPVVDLAAELHISFMGIMHFNKKVDVTNALLRISDSLAYGATARHVFAAVDDPDNQRKLLVRAKNNLAKRDIPALAYGFGVKTVGFDRRLNKDITAPHIVWFGHADVTASEAMQAATEQRAPSARDDAKRFLAELLANGPMSSKDIEEAAEANGISRRTLFRVKGELGITARKSSRKWTWQLPDENSIEAIYGKSATTQG